MRKSYLAAASAVLFAATALTGAGIVKTQAAVGQGVIEKPASIADGYVPVGPVFTGGSTTSFLRLANGGESKATFHLRFFDATGGTEFTTSVIPFAISVPAHGTVQMTVADFNKLGVSGITTISGGTAGYVTAIIQSDQAGFGVGFQNAVYNGGSKILENASSCTVDPSVAVDGTLAKGLFNVHAPAVTGFPSFILLNNPDTVSHPVAGTIYDAVSGTALGAFPSQTIAAKGSSLQTVAQIVGIAGITVPNAATTTYLNIIFKSGDNSALAIVAQHDVVSPSGTLLNLTSFCQINPAKTDTGGTGGGGGTTNPSGS